jgi:hypothetical protein
VPSFSANTPERRAVGNLVATICDNYIAASQPYMYKSFGFDVDRTAKIREMSSAFDAIEVVLDVTGPYVAGSEVSLGDAALLGKKVAILRWPDSTDSIQMGTDLSKILLYDTILVST